jgi:penicillin-binding protein 1C
VIFAVDPDIPLDNQRIFFEASGKGKDLRWFLNGQEAGVGPLVGWAPMPGEYALSLCDGKSRLLDRVSFTVRE